MRASEEQLKSVIRHLHRDAEARDSALVRSLHDDLGGCLVSAAMDLSAIDLDAGTAERNWELVRRAQRAINGAIDLSRGLSEGLKPSLLENFGLFAALRWHLQHRCTGLEVQCSAQLPATELSLTPTAALLIFRIVQETLAMIFAEPELKGVRLTASVEASSLSIKVEHEHQAAEHTDLYARFPDQMLAVAERVDTLGGKSTIDRFPTGTVLIHVFDSGALAA